MSRNLILTAMIAVTLLGGAKAMADNAAPAPAASSATPTDVKPADKLSRALGSISAFDTTAKTITLTGFGGDNQVLPYNDDTKFMLDIPALVSEIKVGDTLRAFTFGDGVDPASTSITPNFLNIVPLVDVNGPPFTGQFTPTEGVVATLTPLTITTPDKKTITVTIGDSTRISKSKDATLADVKTGMFGSAVMKDVGTGHILTELHLIKPPDDNN